MVGDGDLLERDEGGEVCLADLPRQHGGRHAHAQVVLDLVVEEVDCFGRGDDVDAVVCALRDVHAGDEGRPHDALHCRGPLVMQNTSANNLDILQNRGSLLHVVVGVMDSIMNAVMEQLLLKVLHGEPDSAPVVALGQVPPAALHEGERLCLPAAGVLPPVRVVVVDLTVHPDPAVRQLLLLARTLERLGPVDDPTDGVFVVLDPAAEVEVDIEVTEPQLPTHNLGVPLSEPVVTDGHPLHRGPVVNLHVALVGALRTNCTILICLTQSDVKICGVSWRVNLSPTPVSVVQHRVHSLHAVLAPHGPDGPHDDVLVDAAPGVEGAEDEDADAGVELHLDPGQDGQGHVRHHGQVAPDHVRPPAVDQPQGLLQPPAQVVQVDVLRLLVAGGQPRLERVLHVVGHEVSHRVGVPVVKVEDPSANSGEVAGAPPVPLGVEHVADPGGLDAGEQLVVQTRVAEQVLRHVELLDTLDGEGVAGGVVGAQPQPGVGVLVLLHDVLGEVGRHEAHDLRLGVRVNLRHEDAVIELDVVSEYP